MALRVWTMNTGLLLAKIAAGFCIVIVAASWLYDGRPDTAKFLTPRGEMLQAFMLALFNCKYANQAVTWTEAFCDLSKRRSWSFEMLRRLCPPAKRRRRQLARLPVLEDVASTISLRFTLPVLEVYQSSYFRIEFAIGHDDPLPTLSTTNATAEEKKRLIREIPYVGDIITLMGGDPYPCVRLSLCELASSRGINIIGLPGDIVNVWVKNVVQNSLVVMDEGDSSLANGTSHSGEYLRAARFGRSGGNCLQAYPGCPMSLAEVFGTLQTFRK